MPTTLALTSRGKHTLSSTAGSVLFQNARILACIGGKRGNWYRRLLSAASSIFVLVLTAFGQGEYQWSNFAGSPGGFGDADGAGSAARFTGPHGVAVDNSGTVYVADTGNYTIRKVTSAGLVTRLAGSTGSKGSVDGTGSEALFNGPKGVAVDGSANVYVADTDNNTIRKITSDGVVSTLAGTAGSSGSTDGIGSAALFNGPEGVAVDGSGNVYVADSGNHTIRKITSEGVVSTLAGAAKSRGRVDGTGSAARFNFPGGVAVGANGNVYVSDYANYSIRKITSDGVVSTLAGTGSYGSADGTGSAAGFDPTGVAVDAIGNVYVADYANSTIRKITDAGVVTTLAGTARSNGSVDGIGSAARFYYPQGVAVDGSGNVYVADTFNSTIRQIASGGMVSTLAGVAGSYGSADGTGSAAQFDLPRGVAVDGSGNIYVADYSNFTIRKITKAGVVSTLAGTTGISGSADGAGSAARFSSPYGVAVDGGGNVFVADTGNCTIRKITSDGVVSTLAGTTGISGSADGAGSAARFSAPYGVAVDGGGNVFVADTGNCTIRKITSDGVVSTLAGLAGSYGSADGAGSAARFSSPYGVAVDGGGNVFVADTGNCTIRKITSDGVVSTLAGLAGSYGSADGAGSAARFYYPYGVAVDDRGNVYVADTKNDTIRRMTSDGVVSTIGGRPGLLGNQGGIGPSALFILPSGVAVQANGTLYVAGNYNNNIAAGTVPPAGCAITSVAPGSPMDSKSAQPFTINGTGFASGANIILRDVTAGQSYPNRTPSSITSTQIVINPIFTTAAHQWTVEVVNPDGGSTGEFSFNVSAAPTPDLVVEYLSVNPASGGPGTRVHVTASIRNAGTAASLPSKTNIRLASSSSMVTTSDFLFAALSTPALAAGSTVNLVQDVVIPSGQVSGTKYIWVIADANNSAGQSASDGANDTVSTAFTVGSPSPVTGSVTGRLLAPDGSPVAGATIELWLPYQRVAQTTTAADGSYTLPVVPAGTYRVEFSADGFYQEKLPGIVFDGKIAVALNLTIHPLAAMDVLDARLSPMQTLIFPLTPGDTAALATLATPTSSSGMVRTAAAADGASTVLLRYKALQPGKVSFESAGDPSGGRFLRIDSDEPPLDVATIPINGFHYAFARYQVPEELAEGLPSQAFNFVTTFTPKHGVVSTVEFPFTLKRPPVLLVHGIWSGKSAWDEEQGVLRKLRDVGFEVRLADYEGDHAASLAKNGSVIRLAIQDVVSEYEGQRCALTRVDVVGHSMGGILARQHIASNKSLRNYGQGDIRRLITIGTPHLGSELATAVWEVYQSGPGGQALAALLERNGMPIDLGAVQDLTVGSAAISGLKATEVPVVCLAGQADLSSQTASRSLFGVLLSSARFCLLNFLTLDLAVATEVEMGNSIFNGAPNDTVVSVTSQLGGLHAPFSSTTSPVVHADIRPAGVPFTFAPSETVSDSIGDKVAKLLAKRTDLTVFAAGLPETKSLLPHAFRAQSMAKAAQPAAQISLVNSQSVEIISPGEGEQIESGSSLIVSAQAVAGSDLAAVLVVARLGGRVLGQQVVETAPFTVRFDLPADAVGAVEVSVFGRTTAGEIATAPAVRNVIISTSAQPLNLKTETPHLRLTREGATAQLRVSADFSDGQTRVVTSAAAGTVYASSDPTIATVSPDGLVTALANGEALITASNKGETTQVSVAIASIAPAITSIVPGRVSLGQLSHLVISGSGFTANTQLAMQREGSGDPGCMLSNVTVSLDGTRAEADLTVAADAPVGARVLVATSSAGASVTQALPDNSLFVEAVVQTDLSLAVLQDAAAAVAGGRAGLRLVIVNQGSVAATAVAVSGMLPLGCTLRGIRNELLASSGETFSLPLGVIAPGTTITRRVTLASDRPGEVGFALQVSANETDSSPENNEAEVAVFYRPSFIKSKGAYTTLLRDASGVRGYARVDLGAAGSWTAKVVLDNKTFSVRGSFDATGHASRTVGTAGDSLQLTLNSADGIDEIVGQLMVGGELIDFSASHSRFNATVNPATQKGYYTCLLEPTSTDALIPQGTGFGTVLVDPAGNVRLAGTLADGSTVSAGSPVLENGQWPLFVSLYRGSGSLFGTVQFGATLAQADMGASLVWVKPERLKDAIYPAGFATTLNLDGERYKYTRGSSALGVAKGIIKIDSADGIVGAIQHQVWLLPAKAFGVIDSAADRLSLRIDGVRGLLTGTFRDPANARSVLAFRGAFHQGQQRASGFFISHAKSVGFELEAQP